MSPETPSGMRRYLRISLPKGMFAAWYGGGDQQVSRVATLGMGGLFLAASRVRPVGTILKLVFVAVTRAYRKTAIDLGEVYSDHR